MTETKKTERVVLRRLAERTLDRWAEGLGDGLITMQAADVLALLADADRTDEVACSGTAGQEGWVDIGPEMAEQLVCLGAVAADACVSVSMPDIDLDDESTVLAAIAERRAIEASTKQSHAEAARAIEAVRRNLERHLMKLQRDSLVFIINGVDIITKMNQSEQLSTTRDRALLACDGIVINFEHYTIRDEHGVTLPPGQKIERFNFRARTRLFLVPLPPEDRK